jgi:hypothetical protein
MTAPAKPTGRLLLVPTPLDHGCDSFSPLDAVLPQVMDRYLSVMEGKTR